MGPAAASSLATVSGTAAIPPEIVLRGGDRSDAMPAMVAVTVSLSERGRTTMVDGRAVRRTPPSTRCGRRPA